MTTEALKSTSITNADATPVVLNNPGAGAPARLHQVDDYVTPSASMAAGSTYNVIRVPTTAKIKALVIESEAQGAGKFNVGIYRTAADGGAAVDDDFFATDVDCASAVVPTDITNESGTNTLDKRKQPLWQAAGVSADPGGWYDIVLTVHTTAITTGTGKVGLRATFVN